MSLLAFNDVHALYGRARILNGVTFDVDAGERVALVGRNGVGKTTVVNTLCGVTRIGQGHVEIRGRTIKDLRGYTAAQNGIAIVMQGRGILPNLTVEENLLLGTATGRKGPWSLEKVQDLFPILRERRANPGLALSGGQQQMLAIGRALMNHPRLLILDEPVEGLAPVIVEEIVAQLKTIKAAGVAILLVEQNLEVCVQLADRHYIVEQGVIVHEAGNADFMADHEVKDRYLGVGLA